MPAPPRAEDEKWMRAALREAVKGAGHTSPNPAVGAVIVAGGKIIARGWHRRAGEPHAEIEALRALPAGATAQGAALCVTLEPCSTHGRTGPCVDAIIAAGFSRVVIGTLDPNPAHAGKAVGLLESAGIEVAAGVLEAECAALNRAFNKWIVTRMPLVIAKAALSLDGRITRREEEERWISSPSSRADAQKLRASVDAILVGAQTIRDDDPRLTVRDFPVERQPWRVVVSRRDLPGGARVLTDEHRERTIVYRGKTLREALRDLGAREVTSVLIEGGTRVLGEAFDERLVDQVQFYLAPLLLGGPKVVVGGLGAGSTADSVRISNPRYEQVGQDLKMTGDVAP